MLRLLLPLAQLYYCWPCHRRFVKIFSSGPARVAR
jgi:hypothetical protein